MPVEVSTFVDVQNTSQERKYLYASLHTLSNNFRAIMGKGLYAEKIALAYEQKSKGKLSKAVKKLCDYLTKQADIINKCMEAVTNNNFSEFQSTTKELMDNWETLSEFADDVIGVALNIKLVITDI